MPAAAPAAAAPAVPAIPGPAADAAADPAAPTPRPFTPGQLARPYRSDASGEGVFYFHVVEPYEELRERHPETLAENLETTVRINNAARGDRAAQLRALADDHDDPLVTLSDALGAGLGAHFRAALAAGRLPKTEALLSGTLARAGGVASSTFAEKYYYGEDRPFVVAPERIVRYHRGAPGDDDPYSTTPSYPSGHANKATWTVTLLSLMLPELGPQLQARGAEAGRNRVLLGVHYPLDVMAGRMMGTAAAADRWADPGFRPLIEAAAGELRAELEYRCGAALAECIAADEPYLDDAAAVAAYTAAMGYGFAPVGAPGRPMTVPEGYAGLLATRFPGLDEAQRAEVLAATALDSGLPLDRAEGASHMRVNLARALAAEVEVAPDGSLRIRG
ncbi:hypothetical protein CSPHI_08715 [Corynebacterium sphenisci DSM 44792]|uniref:Phosphatidic acid phosphatase type 2/haloperoxidase domain-containing protein n=1 Tax=Corynebacterium sphenisci DSM 44792 TaxID=1437874 RepID=A0A1L7CYW7_9CORY|nr:hypothetical protein CSPHI_08715 [Corynebacterium sphenisci DSM 44792]